MFNHNPMTNRYNNNPVYDANNPNHVMADLLNQMHIIINDNTISQTDRGAFFDEVIIRITEIRTDILTSDGLGFSPRNGM